MANDAILWVLAIIMFSILAFGVGATLPHDDIHLQPNQIKKTENFHVDKIEPDRVYYTDGDTLKFISYSDHGFFIIPSNSTYLEKVTFGGLADFYQWKLHIKTGD